MAHQIGFYHCNVHRPLYQQRGRPFVFTENGHRNYSLNHDCMVIIDNNNDEEQQEDPESREEDEELDIQSVQTHQIVCHERKTKSWTYNLMSLNLTNTLMPMKCVLKLASLSLNQTLCNLRQFVPWIKTRTVKSSFTNSTLLDLRLTWDACSVAWPAWIHNEELWRGGLRRIIIMRGRPPPFFFDVKSYPSMRCEGEFSDAAMRLRTPLFFCLHAAAV